MAGVFNEGAASGDQDLNVLARPCGELDLAFFDEPVNGFLHLPDVHVSA